MTTRCPWRTCSSRAGNLGSGRPAGFIKLGEMVVSDYAFCKQVFVDAVIDVRNQALLARGCAKARASTG